MALSEAEWSLTYGASTRTLVWLGETRIPGVFVLFCRDALLIRVKGIPPTSVVNDADKCRLGPMTKPDATPMDTPALSPLVRGTTVLMLCAGAQPIKTL